MVVLRAVSLIGLAMWIGGLATIGFAALGPWTWTAGWALILLLIVRALLGPRPRHLGVRVLMLIGVLALTFAVPRWMTPQVALLISIATGLGLIWLEAADGRRYTD